MILHPKMIYFPILGKIKIFVNIKKRSLLSNFYVLSSSAISEKYKKQI